MASYFDRWNEDLGPGTAEAARKILEEQQGGAKPGLTDMSLEDLGEIEVAPRPGGTGPGTAYGAFDFSDPKNHLLELPPAPGETRFDRNAPKRYLSDEEASGDRSVLPVNVQAMLADRDAKKVARRPAGGSEEKQRALALADYQRVGMNPLQAQETADIGRPPPGGAGGQDLIDEETAQNARNIEGDRVAQNERIGAKVKAGEEYAQRERAGEFNEPAPSSREDRLRRTQGLQSIAEGLGNIDFRGFGALSKVDEKRPYKAENLRSLKDRQEDEMTPEERATVAQAVGVEFPDGMTWTKAQKLIPNITSLRKAERAEELALGKRGARNKELLQRAIAKERGDRLNPSSTVAKLKEGISTVNDVQQLLKQNNPVAARVAMVKIAKSLAGDTGVLTQQDIDAYAAKIGIPGFFTSAMNFATGDFTADQRERMQSVAETLGAQAKAKLQEQEKGRDATFHATWKDDLDAEGVDLPSLGQRFGSSPAEAGGGKIRVREKASGTTGSIDADEFDPAIYEKL